MRADTWREVARAGVYFAKAIQSRLHAYSATERQRRREADAEWLRKLADVMDEEMSEDALHVHAWMAENGFSADTHVEGIDEKTEVAISAATEAFRDRLKEIFGHDEFSFHIELGVDNEHNSP